MKCGLATILEDCPVGYEFTPDAIPLHLTHIDSLAIDMDLPELQQSLQALFIDQRAFKVKALEDKMYGPDKDIPVTELELTPALRTVHDKIMQFLADNGVVLKRPQFHGEFYVPHVSIYGERRLKVGESVPISSLSVVSKIGEADDAPRRVLAVISFE